MCRIQLKRKQSSHLALYNALLRNRNLQEICSERSNIRWIFLLHRTHCSLCILLYRYSIIENERNSNILCRRLESKPCDLCACKNCFTSHIIVGLLHTEHNPGLSFTKIFQGYSSRTSHIPPFFCWRYGSNYLHNYTWSLHKIVRVLVIISLVWLTYSRKTTHLC